MNLQEWIEGLGSQAIVRFGTIMPLILYIFGRPDWTYEYAEVGERWHNVRIYPQYGVMLIPGEVRAFFDLVCNLITVAGLYLQMEPAFGQPQQNVYSYYSKTKGLKKRMMVVKIAVPLICVNILHILFNLVNFMIHKKPVLSLSPIEVFVFILLEPAFHSSLAYSIRRTMKFFWGLIFVLLCIIATWAVLGMILMGGGSNPNPYYVDLQESYWTSLTVLNGANWPNPIIPSFSQSSAYIFYFLAFVLLVEWGFLNLILALIISSFEQSWERRMDRLQKERGRKEVEEMHFNEEWLLSQEQEINEASTTSNPLHGNGNGTTSSSRSGSGSGSVNSGVSEAAKKHTLENDSRGDTPKNVLLYWTVRFYWLADKSVTVRGQHAINAMWIIMGLQFRFASDPSTALIVNLVLSPFILVVRKVGLLRDKKKAKKRRLDLITVFRRHTSFRRSRRDTDKSELSDISLSMASLGEGGDHQYPVGPNEEEEEEDPNKNKFNNRAMRWNFHILLYIVLLVTSISFFHECDKEGPYQPADDDENEYGSTGCSHSVLNNNIQHVNSDNVQFAVVVIRLCVVILLNLSFLSSAWYVHALCVLSFRSILPLLPLFIASIRCCLYTP